MVVRPISGIIVSPSGARPRPKTVRGKFKGSCRA
jgi:hypothetical protein